MPLEMTQVQQFREYLQGVMDRAEHHAGNVDEIALAVAGAVIWRMDDGPLEAFTREGQTKNVLWARINGRRFAFSYNHEEETIEVREGTTQGHVVRSFSNDDSAGDVAVFFRGL
jgi:Integron cassette protein VCH_CASS1 chain